MISDEMFTVWIILNLSNLWSLFILIFARVQLKNSDSNTSTKEFRQAMAIINPVAIAQFFEIIYTEIFTRFLAARSTESGLLGLVFTYFEKIKTNNQEILHLHCLI